MLRGAPDDAPDAASERPVRCVCQTARTGRWNSIPVASGAVRPVLTRHHPKHQTLKPASGAHRPVQCQNANLSAHGSGGHRTRPVQHKERPVTPRRADKAHAQGLSAAVSSLPSPISRRARALTPPPSIVCRFPAGFGVFPRARFAKGLLPFPLLALVSFLV